MIKGKGSTSLLIIKNDFFTIFNKTKFTISDPQNFSDLKLQSLYKLIFILCLNQLMQNIEIHITKFFI